MATPKLNSLLKYRFTKKVPPKLDGSSQEGSSGHSSDSMTNGDSEQTDLNKSPTKSSGGNEREVVVFFVFFFY